jgi:hypothetical protein
MFAFATLACASCEVFYELGSLTGGTCDAACDDAWVSGGDAGWAGDDAQSDAPGPQMPDVGGAGLPDGASRDSGTPGTGSFDSGTPGTGPFDAASSDTGSGAPEASTSAFPDSGPPTVDSGPVQVDAGGSCACVPAPPAGWTGPVATWEGAEVAPPCSGAYSAAVLDAFENLVAGDAQCTCDCGSLTGATCPSSFTATVFSDQGCATACDSVLVSAGACVDVHGVCANVHGIGASPQAQGGSCAPKSSAQVPKPVWGLLARACESAVAPVQNGCSTDQVCAPAPAAPMQPRLCVFMAGDVACPAGGYSVKRTVYAGLHDSRACTLCSCGAPTGASCTATLQEGCGQTGPVNQLPTTCGGLSDPGSVMLLATLVASGGSCSPVGGAPTGSAAPSSPTTVCCMP